MVKEFIIIPLNCSTSFFRCNGIIDFPLARNSIPLMPSLLGVESRHNEGNNK
jgi:hypothetical protein